MQLSPFFFFCEQFSEDAVGGGNVDFVEQLLKCAHGVAPPTASGRTDGHVTPIDVAKHNNHMEVVQLPNGAAARDGDAGGAVAAAASGAAAAEATLQQPHIIAILKAESSLLPTPLPAAALHWLQGGSAATPSGEPHYDLAKQATEWLIKVVQAAHLSPRIRQAGRKLMACYTFTANLNSLGCWSEILIPQLTATLKELGAQAKEINAASHQETVINTAAILAIAAYNLSVLPDGHATPRDVIRQDMLMPTLTNTVSSNFKRDWKAQPEYVYVHVLLLIATALNPLFGAALETLLSELEGVEVHSADIKSFTRMINKLMTADDHRYVEQQPRPAMNIDIVRRLVSATTPEAVLELVKLVAARFGGLSYVKCLPELAATNPAAADARYHMLPVMVTVVFAPHGVTVGSLLKDPIVLAAWAKLRATRPSDGVSAEEWEAFHDAAVQCLEESDPNEPATMHCEVQVVTTAMAAIRNAMHEVYKVVRASSGAQLHADVAKPEVERVVNVNAILSKVVGGSGGRGGGRRRGGGGAWGFELRDAAFNGRIATVKRLLVAVRGSSGSDSAGSGSGGGGVDVNWQDKEDGTTAVWCAAQNGHLSVVLVLLEHDADPNIARTTTGSTPMCMAAQKGFFEVVRLLLEKNADPNQARTNDGYTPLHAAAENGHVDAVTVLLAKNADPNQATTDNGYTPLHAAAADGHVTVVTVLLAKNADPNQATTDDGQTPLYAAAEDGHVDVVTALLAKNANPNQATTDDGQTPLRAAAEKGQVDVVSVLLANNADADAANTNGHTALYAATCDGHVDVVVMLLAAGAKPSPVDFVDGQTAISIAAQEGHLDVIKLLVDAGGVTGTALTTNGATDLWFACYGGHVDVVRYLATQPNVEVNQPRSDQKDGDADADDDDELPHPGTTPLEVAVLEGHTAIADLLRQHSAV